MVLAASTSRPERPATLMKLPSKVTLAPISGGREKGGRARQQKRGRPKCQLAAVFQVVPVRPKRYRGRRG